MAEERSMDVQTEPRIDDDMAEAIFKARRKVGQKRQSHDMAREAAKDAKAELEASQLELERLLIDAEQGQGQLFAEPDAENDVDPEWRAVRLDSLTDPAIPPKTLEKLVGAGIETMGDLSDHDTAHPNKGITTIAGIGGGAAEKVSDATLAYWARNPNIEVAGCGPAADWPPADWPTADDIRQIVCTGGRADVANTLAKVDNLDVLDELYMDERVQPQGAEAWRADAIDGRRLEIIKELSAAVAADDAEAVA